MSRGLADQLRRLFVAGSLTGLGEGALLDRFVRLGDSEAFEALVVRHGPMVLSVCRRFLRNPHDVEDAFQATFLVLSRKAASLRKREALAPWLFGVAYKVATRARSRAITRLSSSRALDSVAATDEPPEIGMNREEASTLLHEELARLPEADRAPLVLCYFEGLTHDEAADRLRWPVGTVRGRLARARGKLRARLTRRGLEPNSLNLADARFRPPIIPIAMARSVSRSALSFATRSPLLVAASPSAVVLAREVLRVMILKPLMMTAALSTTLLLTVAGPVLSASRGGSDPAKPRATSTRVSARRPPTPPDPSVYKKALRDYEKAMDEWVKSELPEIVEQEPSVRVKAAREAYDKVLDQLVIDVTEPRLIIELGTVQMESIKKQFGEYMDLQLDINSGKIDRNHEDATKVPHALVLLQKEMRSVLARVEQAKVALSASERQLNEWKSRPRPTERIEVKIGDRIIVEVLESLPGRPISGERLVRADGTISLGFYGDHYVAGKSLVEAKEILVLALRKFLPDEVLGLHEIDPETGGINYVPPKASNRVFVDITGGPTISGEEQ